MASANVYSPISGQFWSGECYCYITSSCPCNPSPNPCTNPAHPCYHCRLSSAGGTPVCCPIDIGGASGGDPLYLYTDCSVASVQTIQDIGGCCSGGTNNVVLVKMFSGANATGTFIGAVAYLHVDNPIANGIYNAGLKCRGFSYWAIQVGNFVSDPGNCSCYKGVHSHMQRDGGSSGSFSCGQSLTGGGGGSVIFSWTF